MLEEKLQPVLIQLRAEERTEIANYEIVRSWFLEHEENLAGSMADMVFLCELPNQERRLLSYPVMGNWYLDKISEFKPETEHQRNSYALLRELVMEKRFNNSHTRLLYAAPEEFNARWEQMTSQMLTNANESMPLHNMMQGIHKEVSDAVYSGELPQKESYTIDIGHGLASVSNSFGFLTWYFDTVVKHNETELGLTIMVIDDQDPEEWYKRMLTVGFKEQKGQQGYFFDCESALEALEKGHYDVILSDLELGEGKMDGIEFVERAYDIQKRRSIKPRLSVFSYNEDKLNEAEEKLRDSLTEPKLFHQVNLDNRKAEFNAMWFRNNVYHTLRREREENTSL